MKKLILAGIATLSFIGNIEPVQTTQSTPSFQLFSSAMAQQEDDEESGGGVEVIIIIGESPAEDDPITPGGSNTGGGTPGNGNNGPTGGGGTLDPVEICEIEATEKKTECTRNVNTFANSEAALCIRLINPLRIIICEIAVQAAREDALGDCEVDFETDKALCD